MRRTSSRVFSAFLFIASGVSSTLGQIPEGQIPVMTLVSPTSSLQELSTETVISQVTINHEECVLKFRYPESKMIEKERIQSVPWILEPDVPYTLTAKRTPEGKVELTNPRLQFMTKWNEVEDAFIDRSAYAAFTSVINDIPANALSIPLTLRPKLEQATAAVIIETPVDSPEHEYAVDLFYLQKKSYRGDQQIPYSVFEKAGSTCLTACGIRVKGASDLHGSGVLVGNKLVLTCAHNFDQVAGGPTNCEALFSFIDTSDKRGFVFAIDEVIHCSPGLDFCLVKLGNEIRGGGRPEFTLPNATKLGAWPELSRDDGIYVAGHPEGRPLSVALHGQVVYPYWVKQEDTIKSLIELTVLHMFSSSSEYENLRNDWLPRVKLFFSSSYTQQGADGFFFRPQDFPTIGADPDTKKGDSGSPVFDVKRNSLVGILRGAMQSDGGGNIPSGANHSYFEFVIPISEIVHEINSAKPNWIQTYGVSFYGEPN